MDCLVQEIQSWNQNLDFKEMPQNPIGKYVGIMDYFINCVNIKLKITDAEHRTDRL